MSTQDVECSSNNRIDKVCHKTEDAVATLAMNNTKELKNCVQQPTMEVIKESTGKPSELSLQGASHLASSFTSSLADTPGDSGVLCLDSESSEVTNQTPMTHSMVGAEELACDSQSDSVPSSSSDRKVSAKTNEDIVPELLDETSINSPLYEKLPDVVLKALGRHKDYSSDMAISKSMEPKKSLSEDIVYRRKCKKKSLNGSSSQKKRVSFHEDILNNTKTDNIHIERGFVTYADKDTYCDRFRKKNNVQNERFSWCASGDNSSKPIEVAQQTMSDILTYGNENDKTGLFEYLQDNADDEENGNVVKDINNEKPYKIMYGCDSNSSDSNFSCDSESLSGDSLTHNSRPYNNNGKQKSNSCDGYDNNTHKSILKKIYFSEGDIDQSHNKTSHLEPTSNPIIIKSVLKKNRYIPTNVVQENRKNKKLLNLLDTQNIIGSLKSFYKNLNLSYENGVVESSIDLNNVVEALSDDVNQNKKLCKSLDSGFQNEDDFDFVEMNMNDNKKTDEMTSSQLSSIVGDKTPREGSPRHKLTLNMNTKGKNNNLETVTKYVVNCESTVYEHQGVSYSYVHDTFQTSFDAPKQSFVPLPETNNIDASPAERPVTKTLDLEIHNRTSTPKRHNQLMQEDLKNALSKHLSSPKRQNRTRSFLKNSQENILSDECSNTDTSTIKGTDDFPDDYLDTPTTQKMQTSKSSLLNRYLKSIHQRKDLEIKIKNNEFYQMKMKEEKGMPIPIIYPYKNISKTFHVSAKRMSWLIDKEVIDNKRLSVKLMTADAPSYFDSFEDNVAVECSEKLRLQIFSHPDETLNRMMKVRSPYSVADGSWIPLLVFITNYALYLACVQPGGTEYEVLCRLPHNELDAIAVGPDSQYVQIIDTAGNIACSVVTAETSLGLRLAASLEWSARTSPLRVKRPPAVLPLTCRQLAAAVAKRRHEKIRPEVLFYGRVCSCEGSERLVGAPGAFAPPLEGYLMCKMDKSKRFEPRYFLLRAGTLSWGLHSPDGSPPPNSLPLRSVLGVRRVGSLSPRPHCFEIAPNKGPRLVLAAPDEPTASSWLQSLLLHAAQALEEKSTSQAIDASCSSTPPACTVIVTSQEVISVRESLDPAFVVGASPYLRDRGSDALLREYIEEMRSDIEILACGNIRNLTAFKIPDSDDNWCCLEWSVCEARERGAGLALMFASSTELEKFIAVVEKAFSKLTSEPFPLSIIEGSKSACGVAYTQFDAAWSKMLPAQQ